MFSLKVFWAAWFMYVIYRGVNPGGSRATHAPGNYFDFLRPQKKGNFLHFESTILAFWAATDFGALVEFDRISNNEYDCQCSLQLKFKQNMYVFSLI